MPAECLGSAGFYRGHHFKLGETDMPSIGPPPRRAVLSKDVSNLQLRSEHRPRASLQPSPERMILQLLEPLEGAGRIADCLRGDMGIARRRAQLGMAEQNLDHPNIRVCLQKMGRKTVA